MDAASCQNCYICYRETIDGFPMLTKLKYSKSLLFLLINEFLNADQKYRFSRDEIVCEKCMFTLNRYDLAWLTAKCIKQEIKDAVDVTDRTYRQTGNIGFLDPSDDVLSALCESEFNAYQNDIDEQMAEDEEASNVITTDGEDAQQVREVAANEEADNYNSADDDDVEKYSLKQELSETRETIEIYVCESCYQEFESLDDLKNHVGHECDANKSKKRPTSAVAIAESENRMCRHCNKTFSSIRQFKVHDAQFHRPKKCGVCQKTFPSQIELREHKRIEHELHISFRCPICERAFSGELNLHRHIQTHRDPATPLSCNICGQIEKNAIDLGAHVTQHNNRLECTVCGKILKHKSNLVLHMRIHTGEKFFQCDKCGKEFVHKSSLRMHLQTTHTEVRTKQCTECSMRFKTTSQLNQHLVTHTKRRSHSCPTCGKLFGQRHNMLAHHRMHTTAGRENRHLKRHVCHECDAFFSRPSHLQVHMRRKHGDTDETSSGLHSPSVEYLLS